MTTISEPWVFQSTVTFNGTVAINGALPIAANSISNAQVIAGAEIAAAKLQHRHVITHSQKDGVDVVSETELKWVARAAATLTRFTVRPRVAPTGGDKQFTVDIQKAIDGSNTWTSLLSAAVIMSSADTNDTLNVGTLIGSPVVAANDAIRIVVTASGTTGSQGQGFVATSYFDETGA